MIVNVTLHVFTTILKRTKLSNFWHSSNMRGAFFYLCDSFTYLRMIQYIIFIFNLFTWDVVKEAVYD